MPRQRIIEKRQQRMEDGASTKDSGSAASDYEESEAMLNADRVHKPLASLSGAVFIHLHSFFGSMAFIVALLVACYTQFEKIVRNQYYGYPDEWFPSVSAAVGDRYPARSVFQILVGITAGPRFALLLLWYLYASAHARYPSTLAKTLLAIGMLRTVACGVFVFITSTDDHDIHDGGMLLYILCTFPYMFGTIWHERRIKHPAIQRATRWRQFFSVIFVATLFPLAYCFVQHKVHQVKGAYSIYALLEWSLIFYDVAFDACSAASLRQIRVQVFDTSRLDTKHDDTAAFRSYGNRAATPATSTAASQVYSLLHGIATREYAVFAANVYLAYIFWSLLTAVPLAIWYFPLWHMGLSGDELFLFANMGAVLLGIPFIFRWMNTYRSLVQAATVLTLGGYLLAAPAYRLYATALGAVLTCLAWFSSFSARSTSDRAAYAWLLGLVASCVVKAAWRGNNPIWPIMHAANGGWNGVGLLLGLVASVVSRLDSAAGPASITTTTTTGTTTRFRSTTSDDETERSALAHPSKTGWIPASFGFGALLFALHTVFSDASTPLRWAVDGHPHTGANPVPWGMLTLLAMCGGLGVAHRRFTLRPFWLLLGMFSIAVFSACTGWLSFIGGLAFAVFLFSVAPSLTLTFGAQPLGRSLLLAMLTYNLLLLAHVWTVAYEFVPGGPLLRERTGLVMAVMTAMLAAGCLQASARPHIALYPPKQLHPQQKHAQETRRRTTRTSFRHTAVLICVLGALAHASRIQLHSPQPFTAAEHRTLTTAIWTIHFGIDNDMWASEERMATAIEELGIDVIGLLESDLQRVITGNRDLTQSLGERLNMYTDYGPAASKHTWGCTMLSKFPILHSSHHLLPSPHGELACAIYATLDVYGTPVDVIVSHNGQEENLLDRQQQTTELARIARTTTRPIIFLGYVVSKPFGEIYNLLMGQGALNDVDATDWDRWCEYIAFRGVRRLAYARVSHGRITDTEIQTAKFQLLEQPSSVAQDVADAEQRHRDNLARDEQHRVAVGSRIPADNVSVALRYPPQFYGNGVRGHRYHVFNEPRYFSM